jgi:hypothetical protein
MKIITYFRGMKNTQSFLLMLLIFLAVGGVNAVLGLMVLSYALISKFWFVILYIPSLVLLGVLFSRIKFPNTIYRMGGWSLVVGFLGLLGIVFYSIFIENIDEKVLYIFVSIATTGMIITYPFLQTEK